jgi:NADPH2:quinone reductase
VLRELGPPEVLTYETLATPVPGPNDVLIDVDAVSVEGGDLLARTVIPLPRTPHVIGYAASGTVAALGTNVTSVAVGQRVVGFSFSGAYATRFCVPEFHTYPVPDALDLRVAPTLIATFVTAEVALFEAGALKAGQTVFVHGGAGGVGLAAIQLAKAAQATVIATARGTARAERLREFGADHAIAYDELDYADVVRSATAGEGVDLIVDLVGGDAAATSRLISTARDRGRLAVVGAASRTAPSVGFWDLVRKRLTVVGVASGADLHLPRGREMVARHFASAAAGRVRMPIEREFPLALAADAHRYIETNRPFGRVILRAK